MREFWGDQGSSSDELFVNGLNVLTPATSPRSGVNLAVFLFDPDGDKVTDPERAVTAADLLHERFLVLRKGKKNQFLVEEVVVDPALLLGRAVVGKKLVF